MKRINILQKISLSIIALSVIVFSSCTDDLDRFPNNDSTAKDVFATFDGYQGAAAKVYGCFVLSGNEGPAGKPDISGLDEGQYGDFLRNLFNLQELPTDEAMCIWLSDSGISGMNNMNFSPDNPFATGLYNRCMVNIMYANNFISNSTDEILNSKGFTNEQIQSIVEFRNEARFLRAYAYSILLDVFGNPPFADENHKIGDLPQQIKRADLFKYIESELLDIEKGSLLAEPRQAEYGRIDKAAAWSLLARLYLNAKVYTGQERYNDAVTFSRKVIDSGYSLHNNYEHMFLADNNKNNPEFIFSLNYDGKDSWTYGGTSFIINGSFSPSMITDYGLNFGLTDNAGWGGNRTRGAFSQKFDASDKRRLLVGEKAEIEDATSFKDGLATYKYRNINSDGSAASHNKYADNDFPIFRLAEMYLTYAEAVKRGGNGSEGDALNYMNLIRTRAFGNESKNYSTFNAVTLDEILNERARELYWECHRRTDLVRYNYFTTANYIWEWKGGSKEGRAVSNHYNIYPLPYTDVSANTNLIQNPQY